MGNFASYSIYQFLYQNDQYLVNHMLIGDIFYIKCFSARYEDRTRAPLSTYLKPSLRP